MGKLPSLQHSSFIPSFHLALPHSDFQQLPQGNIFLCSSPASSSCTLLPVWPYPVQNNCPRDWNSSVFSISLKRRSRLLWQPCRPSVSWQLPVPSASPVSTCHPKRYLLTHILVLPRRCLCPEYLTCPLDCSFNGKIQCILQNSVIQKKNLTIFPLPSISMLLYLLKAFHIVLKCVFLSQYCLRAVSQLSGILT